MTSESKGEEYYMKRLYGCLKKHKIDFATGVPCGVQKYLIYYLSHDPDILHVIANRESEAIGIAAGAYLAGRKPLVYMQNSGFFNSSNDVASLLISYKIPVFLTVTWRGAPGEDAPQHFVTGKATFSLLDSLGVYYEVLEKGKIENIVERLFEEMEKKEFPVVLLIRRGWWK